MPAIVVGTHTNKSVSDLSFAKEFAFGNCGHVDAGDWGRSGEGAVEEGFGACAELRAFDADYRAVFVGGDVGAFEDAGARYGFVDCV